MSHSAHLQTEAQHYTLIDNNISIPTASYEHLHPVAESHVIENTIFEKASAFSFHNRLRLSLALREGYRSDFVLIRGLIEFHRTRNLKFTFDRKNRSIQADINNSEIDELQAFLGNISRWLRKEKQFRIALKIARDFEKRYQSERDSVYQVMKNATASE